MSNGLKVENFKLEQFAPIPVLLNDDIAHTSLQQTATATVEL